MNIVLRLFKSPLNLHSKALLSTGAVPGRSFYTRKITIPSVPSGRLTLVLSSRQYTEPVWYEMPQVLASKKKNRAELKDIELDDFHKSIDEKIQSYTTSIVKLSTF